MTVPAYLIRTRLVHSANRTYVVDAVDGNHLAVAKILTPSPWWPPSLTVRDLCGRALVASSLGELLGVAGTRVWTVPCRNIDGWPDEDRPAPDELALMSPWLGDPLLRFVILRGFSRIADPRAFASLFLFNLWIGSYDKKHGDYVVDGAGRVSCIDHELSGPHPNDVTSCLGAWAEAYTLSNVTDTGWCAGDGFVHDHLRTRAGSLFDDGRATLQAIEALAPILIRHAIARAIPEAPTELSTRWATCLLSRRDGLRDAVKAWLACGCPRGSRPLRPAPAAVRDA